VTQCWRHRRDTLIWVAGSSLFSWYLLNFAVYNATYGSLSASD